MGTSDVHLALRRVTQRLDQLGVPYAICGGLAVNAHGYQRTTVDVDLLVTLAPGTSALALGGLLLDAQDLLGRPVDIVTETGLHPALRDRVLADAVAL